MLNDGRWVWQEPRERHAFSLCRVTGAGTLDEGFDLLGTIEVEANRLDPEKPAEQLRSWALATLAAGGYGFGRYHAAYGTLDEDGEPDRAFAQEYVDWSGTTDLVPATQAAR